MFGTLKYPDDMKRIGFVMMAFMACLGCGEPKPSGTGSQDQRPATNHIVTSRDKTFELSVPNEWIRADSSEPRFLSAIERSGNKKTAEQLKRLESVEAIQLVLVDANQLEANKPFLDNMNVVVLPLSPLVPPGDPKKLSEDAGKGLLGTSTYKTSVLDTPSGKFGIYQGQTKAGSGSPHDLIGAVIDRSSKRYTITLTVEAGKGAGFEQVMKDVLLSLKFQ